MNTVITSNTIMGSTPPDGLIDLSAGATGSAIENAIVDLPKLLDCNQPTRLWVMSIRRIRKDVGCRAEPDLCMVGDAGTRIYMQITSGADCERLECQTI